MAPQAAAPERPDTRFFLRRPPPRWALLALVCLALVVRGRFMLGNAGSLRSDPDGYRLVAWRIFNDHTIGIWRENLSRVEPTASRPPLYPIVLAAFDFISTDLDPYGFGFLQVVLGVAAVWAVWRLGERLGLPWEGCLLAAALVTVDPILLNQSTQVMTETLAVLLAATAQLALMRSADDVSARGALVAGALLGLCVLCRPTFLVWLVAAVIAFPWCAAGAKRFYRAGLICAAAVAVLTPWALRNQYFFGRPVVTTTHGGATLLLANNPDFYQYLVSAPWGSVWDARQFNLGWETERQQVDLRPLDGGQITDEVAIDRLAYGRAWENIRNEPDLFAYSCLVRLGRLWSIMPHQTTPDESSARRGLRHAVAIWYTMELALAAVGAWSLRRKLFAAPWLWGTLLVLSLTVVHAFYWTDMRMRAPLVCVVALLAAYGVLMLATPARASSSLTADA